MKLLLTCMFATWLSAVAIAVPCPTQKGAAVGREARFEFTSFGDHALAGIDTVAEVTANSVILAGRGVTVVHFEVGELLRGDPRKKNLVVLAAPRDYREGLVYLVFLKKFGSGDRFTAKARIAKGERDYDAKLKVLRQFVAADRITDPAKRAVRIRGILLVNLEDEQLFVRWNALTELGSFVKKHRTLFGPAEKARMVSAYRKEASPTFRRELRRILELLGIRIEGNDR